jgi:polyhydroxyalkanoate synthesis repressor PhaR
MLNPRSCGGGLNIMAGTGATEYDRADDSEPGVVQIKRYPNRRYYDRTSRKYVTLQEIEELVRDGYRIDVRDSRSDEDLTRLILTQILIERHPERMEMFPVALLHLMLRANDLAVEFLRVFFRLSLATLESFQAAKPLTPFVTPVDWMKSFFPSLLPELRQAEEAPDASAAVVQLSRRVAELEERFRQLESSSALMNEQVAIPELKPRPVRRLEDRHSK